MTDADRSEQPGGTPAEDGGVLAKLPRTRPQRSSPRRAAARGASANGRAPLSEAKAPERKLESTRKPAASKANGKVRASKAKGANAAAQSTPKRGSARPAAVVDSAASGRAKAGGSPTRPSDAVRTKRAKATKRPGPAPRRPLAAEEPAPRQGYECEGERANAPVTPPGGPELVATAAELVGELAKAGLSTGERLFRDFFSRLPGS
jgi:hypothetical protein